MVKKAYYKNLRRQMMKSKSRFLAIFFIVFLGAALFAGLRNTPLMMAETVDGYLDAFHRADLTYISTLGFSEEDIQSLSEIDEIKQISYGYQFDALLNNEDQTLGITVYTNQEFNDDMVNKPDLIDGRYPQKDNECLLDESLQLDESIKIGQTIHIKNDQGEKDFEVVGIINDTRYITSMDRGTNTLGNGTNNGYIQILSKDNEWLALPEDLYELRDEDVLYSQINVIVEGASSYNTFSDEYDEYIEKANTKIKSHLSLRMSRLYEDITSDAKEELSKAKKEYNKGYQEYLDGKNTFDSQILEAKIQLANAKLELAKQEELILDSTSELTGGSSSSTSQISSLEAQVNELKEELSTLQEKIEELQTQDPDLDQETLSQEINQSMEEIKQGISEVSTALEGIEQLADATIQINKAKIMIEKQENQLALEEIKTNQKLEKAKEELDKAKEQLDDAQKQISSIPKGTIYTITRHENTGLVSYDSNIDAIESIAAVFPLIFFLVSALVSLTTMTRMVEEQRGQSGTLRALGYTKKDIIMQYVIYVISATFFACILGVIFGVLSFPRIIWYLYNVMMFEIRATAVIVSDVFITVQTIFLSVFVVLFVTLFVCIQELTSMPSVLMRPKAPKIGKRILLERIPFIWKRLSFNHKVTMRNIFRYKKRFFMSIIGIAGCTALIITGFGIKNSVSYVVDYQYKGVFLYDASLRLDESISAKESQENREKLIQRSEVSNIEYVNSQMTYLYNDHESVVGYNVVCQSIDNISNFICFEDYKDNKIVTMDDDGVILTQKAAEQLDVDVGDTIDIEIDEQKYNVSVSHIVKNYRMNYVYMSQTLYENITGNDLEINEAFVNLSTDQESSKVVLEKYLSHYGFGQLSFTDEGQSDFYGQIKSLDIIVIILIAFAGALSFIVLYNLTNINIQERKSEIATIKVLGFRKKEVYDYVFRENIILSVIGSLLGLPLGVLLHHFIMRTVELDMIMFIRHVFPITYVYAIAITIGFTLFINYTMRKVLNKVDIVESLKSIE